MKLINSFERLLVIMDTTAREQCQQDKKQTIETIRQLTIRRSL
jgi:hypothetical protein